MKIAFVTPYPRGVAPSQRFRFEQYFPDLKESGINYVQYPFLSIPGYSKIYKSGLISKALIVSLGFAKRLFHLFGCLNKDLIFIHREATPLGPPWFEYILAKIFRKRLIYDFDDAIWLPDQGANQNVDSLRSRSKVGRICSWSCAVSVGNDYLADYARGFNPNVVINPTVVDTSYHRMAEKDNPRNSMVLGWTGSHTTAKFLEPWLPMLDELREEIPFRFIFISNKPPGQEYPWMEYLPWNIDSEIEDLSKIDIGLMPLPDNPWSYGKCGFKIIQYMATGSISIGSAVGVNREILDEGVNGFFLRDKIQLKQTLHDILNGSIDTASIRENGRNTVMLKYSRKSGRRLFLDTIHSCLPGGDQDKQGT